jgi:NADPH:quinone reductase
MSIMKAVVLEAPGPPEAPQIRHLPIPTPRPGEVLIKSRRFRPESVRVAYPAPPSSGCHVPPRLGNRGDRDGGSLSWRRVSGRPAGGHDDGREGYILDGGYAEYTCVPARQVVPFTSSLDWARLGAAPEMLQTQQAKRSFPCTGSTTWMRSRKRTPRWRQAPLPARLSS